MVCLYLFPGEDYSEHQLQTLQSVAGYNRDNAHATELLNNLGISYQLNSALTHHDQTRSGTQENTSKSGATQGNEYTRPTFKEKNSSNT